MLKKIIYLMAVLWIISVCTAFAAKQQESMSQNDGWQVIDIGPAETDEYSFNTNTIKFDRNNDGTVNKNIIIYEEKKMNMYSGSAEYKYYTITECKINQDMQTIAFGDEKCYTKDGKFRWTNEPYTIGEDKKPVWIPVNPNTIGGDRFVAIVSYAIDHEAELMARS